MDNVIDLVTREIEMPLTLEEWAYHHADELRDNLLAHIEVFCVGTSMTVKDMEDLHRMILTSIRDWAPRGPKP